MSHELSPLTDEERATYEWQMWVPGFGEAGQQKLKGTSGLVSRVGGLGSVVAYELAAAGIGRLIGSHVAIPAPARRRARSSCRLEQSYLIPSGLATAACGLLDGRTPKI